MEIRIITVGKIKEKYLNDGIAEYAKRLGRYCKLNFIQVPDEKTPDKASDAQFFKNDVSASIDADDSVGTNLQGISDYES